MPNFGAQYFLIKMNQSKDTNSIPNSDTLPIGTQHVFHFNFIIFINSTTNTKSSNRRDKSDEIEQTGQRP